MTFTPGMGSSILVGSTEPTVTLVITPPAAPPGAVPTSIRVTVNPGQSYEWSTDAPATGGNVTAHGFRATSGSPGQNNTVDVKYKYMVGGSPAEQGENHSFYLYTQ